MNVVITISVLTLLAYGIIIYRYYSGLSLLKNKPDNNNSLPSVSVVIAVKNEEKNIPKLLIKLKEIQYKGRLEFILVNDHSSDLTMEELKKSTLTNITILRNKNQGKKRAVETGVSYSKNEWIAVTDADCLMSPDWLTSMVSRIDDSVNMVLGPVFIDSREKDFCNLQKNEFYGLQGATAGSAAIGAPISANGANMMFKRSVFTALKPYKSNYHLNTGDDQFLLMAIHKKYPGSITYSLEEKSIVRTVPVRKWRKYWEQRIRWASKGSSYTDWNLVITGLVVFLASLISVAFLIIGAIFQHYYLWLLILFKLSFDFFLIKRVSTFAKESLGLLSFFVSGIVYPFVVVISVIGGVIKR